MTGRGRKAGRVFWPWLGLWAAVGLGIRLASLFGVNRSSRVAGGDAYYYHNAANLLVEGKGFINPFLWYPHNLHHAVQTASWPPLFVFVLAMTSVVGLKSFFAHRVWCCIIGTGAIVLCGLTGREIGGRRVGLFAALLVAVYSNIWMSNELALSETLSPVLVAVVLLAAYRFWKQPGRWTVVALAAAIAVAALGRDELALLAVLILLPMVLMATGLSWARRGGLLAVGSLTALLIVSPWIGYNMSRFTKPVFISSGFGITLASANCNDVYSGPYEGYWSFACALRTPLKPLGPTVDESEQGAEAQAYALHFVRTHLNRVVPVELARLGRAFGFFHPAQQVGLDASVETRPQRWALTGLWTYYGLFALSIGGVIVLRRRRVPVLPLLAVVLDVVVSVLVTFGQTRYRSPAEVSLVLLAAVQLDWFWSRLRPPPAPAVELGPYAGQTGAGGGDLVGAALPGAGAPAPGPGAGRPAASG
jgi:hypothetical protein